MNMFVEINLALQVLDGVLTYIALAHGYGEGNPVLAALIQRGGAGPVLVGAKLVSIACVVGLRNYPTLQLFLMTTTILFAIIPWAIILAN